MTAAKSRPDHYSLGSGTLLVQWLIILFFIPFICLAVYLMIASNSKETGAFYLVIVAASILFVKVGTAKSEIEIRDGVICLLRPFGTRKMSISECNEIESVLQPILYVMKFRNGTKAYFTGPQTEIRRQFFSLSPTDHFLIGLRTWIREEQEKLQFEVK